MHAIYIGAQDLASLVTSLPLAAGTVRAGFPSPADDYTEAELDLVSHLVQPPARRFTHAPKEIPWFSMGYTMETY